VRDKYHITGFISSGTYGRVYKAVGKVGQKGEFAIKKLVFLTREELQADSP
jgi:cyclin-dependent kinase 8/11